MKSCEILLQAIKVWQKSKFLNTWNPFVRPPWVPWSDNWFDDIQEQKTCHHKIVFHFRITMSYSFIVWITLLVDKKHVENNADSCFLLYRWFCTPCNKKYSHTQVWDNFSIRKERIRFVLTKVATIMCGFDLAHL